MFTVSKFESVIFHQLVNQILYIVNEALEGFLDIFMLFILKWTENSRSFINHQESDDVYHLDSLFYLAFYDDRCRVKIM